MYFYSGSGKQSANSSPRLKAGAPLAQLGGKSRGEACGFKVEEGEVVKSRQDYLDVCQRAARSLASP